MVSLVSMSICLITLPAKLKKPILSIEKHAYLYVWSYVYDGSLQFL